MKRLLVGFIFCSLSITAIAQGQMQNLATTPAPNSAQNITTAPAVTPSNYQILNIKKEDLPKGFHVAPGKTEVIEFFSYGCPWCFKLDPNLNQWIAHKPANVSFERAPVSFEQGWDNYQKAYYIAEKLGIENKLHNTIFSLAQNPLLGLNSPEQIRSFFLNNGVTAAAYDKAANDPSIQKSIDRGNQLMKAFKIMSIPTVIITNGTKFYMINNSLVNANNGLFIATLQYIVKNHP